MQAHIKPCLCNTCRAFRGKDLSPRESAHVAYQKGWDGALEEIEDAAIVYKREFRHEEETDTYREQGMEHIIDLIASLRSTKTND